MTIFNWKEYYILARNLSKKHDEASLRSAVSRAYYAVFCIARNYALTSGIQISGGSKAHQEVEKFCSGLQSIATVGSNLGRLRIARNQCDYDNKISNIQNIVQLSLLQAEAALRFIP